MIGDESRRQDERIPQTSKLPPVPRASLLILPVAALAVGVGACARPAPPPPAVVADSTAAGSTEVAVLEPDTVDVRGVARVRARVQSFGEGDAEGVVTLSRIQGGTRVQASLEGLSNREYHALQILRGRECDADPDVHLGVDAGTPHGGLYAPPGHRHIGDLGSIRGDGGTGRYDRIAADLDLSGTMSPVGRAVVVRALRDDATSPGGAAGQVIGCGILERS